RAAAQARVHGASRQDPLGEHADGRARQYQEQPPGLGPAAEVMAAEDVDDDPGEQVYPEQPDEEEHHGQEGVEQRVTGHLPALRRGGNGTPLNLVIKMSPAGESIRLTRDG